MQGCWWGRPADIPFLSMAQTERGLLGSSETSALYTHSPGSLPALLGDGIKTGFNEAGSLTSGVHLPDTECLLSHSKCHSRALSPKTGHPNSNAWGTEDPALGGTRGGKARRWHCSSSDSSHITLISEALQQKQVVLEGMPEDAAVHRALEVPRDSRSYVHKMWTSRQTSHQKRVMVQAAQLNIAAQQPQSHWSQGLFIQQQQQNKTVLTWLSSPAQSDWSLSQEVFVLPPMP